jgi:hypothetical protein
MFVFVHMPEQKRINCKLGQSPFLKVVFKFFLGKC